MKRIEVLAKSATACAALLLVAACGGGGSSGNNGGTAQASSQPSVTLSGTAATGAALANASVAVKCANATGTATTDASGKYSLSLTGGALPCVIQVTGEQGGVAVTLHSLAEAGTTDSASGTTSAAANVTPLTEMIVAQLSAGLPSDLFAAFGSGTAVSTEQLVAATNAVLTAIKDATGIDLGTIDPFKAQLVAATSSTPDGGNLYDQLLDQLGTKISIEALPQVVNQIASASGSGSSTGLGDAMESVQKGPLAGCPIAASGKYRTIDHYGRMTVRDIDFGAGTYKSADGSIALAITADSAKPCEFTADGTQQTSTGAEQVHFDFAMGNAGIALYRSQNQTTGRTSVGYMFPVQSHAKSALAGTWSMLQSGYTPYDGFIHWMEKMTFNADDKIDICDIDYRNAPGTCIADPEANISVAARSDGGFDVIGVEDGVSGPVANMYAYRAPSGAVNVFGTTNPAGLRNADGLEVEETHFILTKHQALEVPAVGTVSKYFDAQLSRLPGSQNETSAPVADSNKVTSVNGSAVTRERASDGRIDTVHYNDPMDGVRHRDAGTGPDGKPFAEVFQFTVPGSGLNVSINARPASSTQRHIYAPSVQRN